MVDGPFLQLVRTAPSNAAEYKYWMKRDGAEIMK
jgi:hypothetical protein